jgi:tetratricopeptide (TPR) repeat protein
VFAVVFLLGAALAFAGAYFVRYRPGVERERFLLRAAVWAAVLVVAGGIAAVAASGNPFGSDTQIGQGPNRLAEGSLNNRWGWWKEAWHGFAAEPLGGNGAGSFELVHRKYRESAVEVQEAHSLPLQFASETGLVGLLLAAGAAGAALVGAWRALGRLGGEERAAGVALAAVLPAFLVHGALDYDWDFVALCGPVLFVAGALFAAGRGVGRVGRRHAVWAVALVLVAWAGLYSIAAPRVAAAKVDDAYAQLERGDLEQAVDSAKGAHSLDPVSVAPLEAWASAEEADGNIGRARELYVQSVELQPLNWATWYELGRFDREVIGDERAARREFRRANELDPHNCAVRQALSLPCEG